MTPFWKRIMWHYDGEGCFRTEKSLEVWFFAWKLMINLSREQTEEQHKAQQKYFKELAAQQG